MVNNFDNKKYQDECRLVTYVNPMLVKFVEQKQKELGLSRSQIVKIALETLRKNENTY